MKPILASASLLSLLLLAGGCSRTDVDIDGATADAGRTVARISDKVERKVRDRMETETLKLDGDGKLPLAELAPDGTLVIDGTPLPMTAEQRAAAVAYRTELTEIAAAGAAVGVQGAQLGIQALAEAASSLIDGDERALEERIEDKAGAIRESAKALCDRLPRFIAAQQAFAAAVPEFAPYADANRADVENCRVEFDPPTIST